jgi:hypothetical protein
MLRIARLPVLATVVVALLAAPASADPANKNADVLTFECTRGSATTTFRAVGILQSRQVTGQVLGSTSVVTTVHIEINGQVIFDIPGQAGRSDLWTCSVEEIPGALAYVFLTPR